MASSPVSIGFDVPSDIAGLSERIAAFGQDGQRPARTATPSAPAEVEELWDPQSAEELMRAYETDKAVYEVLYEARHRPDWLAVPMAAIRRLAACGDREAG